MARSGSGKYGRTCMTIRGGKGSPFGVSIGDASANLEGWCSSVLVGVTARPSPKKKKEQGTKGSTLSESVSPTPRRTDPDSVFAFSWGVYESPDADYRKRKGPAGGACRLPTQGEFLPQSSVHTGTASLGKHLTYLKCDFVSVPDARWTWIIIFRFSSPKPDPGEKHQERADGQHEGNRKVLLLRRHARLAERRRRIRLEIDSKKIDHVIVQI